MEKGSVSTEKIALGAEAALHQIFLRLRDVFGTEATDIWPNCCLPSSNDGDYHNSHTSYGYYDWFLVDSKRSDRVVLALFSDSKKLTLIFLERELFKDRIACLKKAFEERDDELAERCSPYIDNLLMVYGICLSTTDTSSRIGLQGLGIIDKHIRTTKSVLLGTESRKEFNLDSGDVSILISPDMPELMFSPDLMDRILAFLIWKTENPNGTTFEAQAAGKLDLFPTRE